MSVSNTKDLLSQLTQLEQSLKKFSFEELSTEEANSLGTTFKSFKHLLEHKIFDPNANISSGETKIKSNRKYPKKGEETMPPISLPM